MNTLHPRPPEAGRRWPLPACAALRTAAFGLAALLLASCDLSADRPEAPAAGPHWLAEWLYDGQGERMLLWDPASPESPLQLPMSLSSPPLRIASQVMDAASRRVSPLGTRQLVFVHAERLYALDLSAGAPHAAVQVSSAERLCQVQAALPLQDDGAVAAVMVTQHPEGAGCPTDADHPHPSLLMRTDMSPGTAALPVGLGQLLGVLPQADGRSGRLLLRQQDSPAADARLQLLDAQLKALPPPALPTRLGPTDPARLLGLAPGQDGLGYLVLDSQLWALRWNNQAVQIDPQALAAVQSSQGLVSSGPSGLAYLDGARLLLMAGGTARLLAELDLTQEVEGQRVGADALALLQTDEHVLALLRSHGEEAQCDEYSWCLLQDSLRAVPQAGGAERELLRLSRRCGDLVCEPLGLLGSTGPEVVLARTPCTGCDIELGLINPATLAQRSLPGSVMGVLLAPSAARHQPAAVTQWLLCRPDCATGPLQQQGLDGSPPIDLGLMAFSPATLRTQGPWPSQLPASFSTADYRNLRNRAWQFLPGEANSLRMLTLPAVR